MRGWVWIVRVVIVLGLGLMMWGCAAPVTRDREAWAAARMRVKPPQYGCKPGAQMPLVRQACI